MRQSRTQPTNKQPSGHTATHVVKHPTRNKSRNTHTPPHAIHKARRAQTSAHAQPQQTTSRTKNKETPQPHPTGTVTGYPVIAYAPAPTRTETTPSPNKGIARSRPARSNTGSGQTVDKREIPEHPLEGTSAHAARQPREHGPDKEKREAHTPPARAKAGKPQQAGA